MRVIAVTLIALVLAVVVGLAYGQNQGRSQPPKIVSVSVTVASVHVTSGTRTDVLLLWNYDVRTTPIGHAVKACIRSESIYVRVELMSCTLTVSLPLGKLTASGIVHNLRRFTLIITGGTGVYANAHGPLSIHSVAGGGRKLIFQI